MFQLPPGQFQALILRWPFSARDTHGGGLGPSGRSPETAPFNKLLILDAGGRCALFNNNDNVCSIID